MEVTKIRKKCYLLSLVHRRNLANKNWEGGKDKSTVGIGVPLFCVP